MYSLVEYIIEIDRFILDYISNFFSSPFMDYIMKFFSRCGDGGIVWIIICALLLISKKTRYIGLVALIALLFSAVFTNIIFKELFQRNRPFIGTDIKLLISDPHGYSFPSGHTSSSFAVAFVFGKYFRKLYAILTYVLASLIAFSRLYLFVHYPTDIIFGVILALGCSVLAILLFDQYKNYQEQRLSTK